MMFSGITIACVFLLTKPPYVEALSPEGLGFIGFVTLIFSFFMGLKEVAALLGNPASSAPPSSPPPPAPGKGP